MMTTRRMTSLEKKQARMIKKAKRETKALRKKKKTTMDWIDIDEVLDDRILLKKDKKEAIVMGIKLSAHDIFLDDPISQARWIDSLRICHNRLPFKLYFGFVYSLVNVNKQLNLLTEQERVETDEVCRLMIADDFDKFYSFQRMFRELEFFVMIKCTDPKELEKRFTSLFSEFQRAGFEPHILNKYDYYNYISYVFDNIHISDYCFARGVYSFENVDYTYDPDDDRYMTVNRTESFASYTPDPLPIPLPQVKEIVKSKLAPTAFCEKLDYYTMGEKRVCNMLVRKVPEEMDIGILSQFLNDPKIKMFMTTEPLKISTAAALRREYNEKEQLLRKTKDPTLRERIYTQMRSMEVHIKQSQQDNDLTQNITIVFSVYADSDKELNELKANFKEMMSVQGISVETIPLMQEVLLRLSCPLFFEADIEKTVIDDYGIPGASRAVASMWPYIFETLKDERGMLLGWELANKGIISFDPYYWIHEEAASKLNNRTSGNIITVGKTGMGKSTIMNLIIRDQIKKKARIVWIDPENQCQAMVLRYGGTYIAWGQKGNIINIFDLKKVTTDDDDNGSLYDTQLAIVNVINDLTQILSILFPKIDDDVLNVVADVTYMTYSKVGIIPDENGNYPSFQGMSSDSMPTFKEFAECIEDRMNMIKGDPSSRKELLLLEDLGLKIRRIRQEWGHYFDGHTTISFKNPERQVIAFGSKNLINGNPALRAALNHIMFHFSWDLCLDQSNESMFVIDEAHIMILEKGAAELVSQFFRRSRKYHCVMMIGTQNPRDFADPAVLTYGKAIFDNAVYKFLLYMDQDSTNDITKLVTLNPSEIQLIMRLHQGESIFVCGDRRIPIRIWATEQELNDIGNRQT